ncbi:MAG: hypothetical protein WD942_05735 [Dehalococcoidia bacterium]
MNSAPKIAEILAAESERFEREKDLPPKGPAYGRPRKPAGEVGRIFSLRIPLERLVDLHRLAESKGEQPTVLMRRWILERLDRETRRPRRS